MNGNNQGAESDFAAMFEKSLAGMEKLKPGQQVKTEIVSIGKECVFLHLSGKSEGVIDIGEFLDADGALAVKEGDAVTAYFLESKNGEMRFTTKIAGEKAGSSLLENAYQNRIPVEGTVEKEIKGGYEVRIGDTRAFCPFSQMGTRQPGARPAGSNAEAPVWVGKKLTFRIMEYKDGGKSILVSNRAIEEEARQVRIEELKSSLSEGMTVKGTIASIQDYGAFVELGGVQALLPISEIGRTRVQDIRSTLAVGQEIEAEIIKLDWKNERISLSMKSLLADPWVGVADRYPRDSKHTGTVARIAEFGAFVTLEPGLDGLVHSSLLKGDSAYGNSRTAVKVGQKMSVQILEVDAAARRISLKPATSAEEDSTVGKYLNGGSDTETYNPFAALLKKK